MPRGRPKKQEVAYDSEAVKEYIRKLFGVERELQTLREDKKQLNEEYKGKIDGKLIGKLVRMVKLQLEVENLKASPETIEEVSDIIKDKINVVM